MEGTLVALLPSKISWVGSYLEQSESEIETQMKVSAMPPDVNSFGLAAVGISKTYRHSKRPALEGISLAIESGESFGIIGPNGAGKTTLMGCLLGFLRPDSGRVTIGGRSPDEIAVLSRIGYVPERLVCDRWMTGARFLAFHHELAGLPRSTTSANLSLVLGKVGLNESDAGRKIRNYSKGMLQRLVFAQALLSNPRILFLDEFTSGVDPSGVLALRHQLLDLKRSGVTLIINSHRLDEIERLCDRVAFIRNGQVVSVERLREAADAARIFTVKWAVGAAVRSPSEQMLAELAKRAGATLVKLEGCAAEFRIGTEGVGALLLAALIREGIEVTSALAVERRLETLFESCDDSEAHA